MELTYTGAHWRNAASFAAAGALLLLMGWAFFHHQRWLMYLGLLGLLGIVHAFTKVPSKTEAIAENNSKLDGL